MDISVLTSVGSFVMSERVLKPKASVLVILALVLAYDLTTKTHDSSSLRVYRGPGLLAFSLMMVAYSLRTWRRNGVACDELLFLPGTRHGDEIVNGGSRQNSVSASISESARGLNRNEGDVAAGGVAVEMTAVEEHRRRAPSRARSLSRDSSLSSINEFADAWDEDDTENADSNNDVGDNDTNLMAPLNIDRDKDPMEPRQTQSRGRAPSSANGTMRAIHSQPGGHAPRDEAPHGPVERFRENHPQITRIGTFFFFRSSTTSTVSAAYAPSGPAVVGAAMDLTMPVLINFHLFIEAWNHLDTYESDTPAKILPLIFLTILIVRTVLPPGRRGRFWNTMKFTVTTPFHRVRFRDAYVADVVTSLVRPLQDVIFALAYYVTVIWGSITQKYGLSDSGDILEQSWVLHNVILPSCAMLPLWWKFLQTLRECYDTGNRWPHLGNAFKYLTAALVVLYGMTHPENRRSSWWLTCYIAAVLYQICWDVFMDWELLVIAPRESGEVGLDLESSCIPTRISSVRPNSYVILMLQRKVFLPLRDALRMVIGWFPSLKRIQLRPRRLYKSEAFYWKILAYNIVFRFLWMLSFIPAYHLSASGLSHVATFSSDTNSYVGVLLPVAEILRRTFWGFLFLEMQTIKMTDGDPNYSYDNIEINTQDETELSEDSADKRNSKQYLPSWLGTPQQLQHDASSKNSPCGRLTNWIQCSEETREKLFLAELSTWAVAFVALGLWATT